ARADSGRRYAHASGSHDRARAHVPLKTARNDCRHLCATYYAVVAQEDGCDMNTGLWYTGAPLDRVSNRREDRDWLAEVLRARETRIVPVWRSQNLVHNEEDRALLPTVEEAGDLLELGRHISVLGVRDGVAYVGVDLSHLEDPYQHPLIDAQGAFEDLRKVGPVIAREEGAILAHAQGLMH